MGRIGTVNFRQGVEVCLVDDDDDDDDDDDLDIVGSG